MWPWISLALIVCIIWYVIAVAYIMTVQMDRGKKPPAWEYIITWPWDFSLWFIGLVATVFDPKGYGD